MAKTKTTKKKQEKKKLGITPYAIALVYEGRTPDEDRDTFYADNPFPYAEARLGVASRKESEQAFNQIVDDILSGKCKTDLPKLREWLSETKGKLTFDDLEARIKKKNGVYALTREQAVHQAEHNSSQGTLTMWIRSRKDARKANQRSYAKVTMGNFEINESGLNPVFWRTCTCDFTGNTNNKRRLWKNVGREREYLDDLIAQGIVTDKDVRRPLGLVCYHQAITATKLELQNNRDGELTVPRLETVKTTIPFDFIDCWDLVFEAMARKYRFNQDMAEVDEYLWQHDIMTDEFKKYMKQGVIHREVIKSERFFDPLAKKIIMALYKRMHERNYKFRGFSRELIGFKNRKKDYECIGIVFEKNEVNPDLSYRIIYAPESNINLPFIIEKRFYNPDQRQPKPLRYQRSPLRLWKQKKRINTLDDRTGRVVDTAVYAPTRHILDLVPEAEEPYEKVLKFFKAHLIRKR